MSSSSADVSSHAPLIDRLRGRAWLAGVDYVTQADAWMREAADRIEQLERQFMLSLDCIRSAIGALHAAVEQAPIRVGVCLDCAGDGNVYCDRDDPARDGSDMLGNPVKPCRGCGGEGMLLGRESSSRVERSRRRAAELKRVTDRPRS